MWAPDAQNEFLNGVMLSLETSLGMHQTPLSKVNGWIQNVHFVDDDKILYLCGKHLVLFDIIRKKQTYIMRTLEDEQINAITYYNSNQNNKQIFLVAISLKSEKCP